MSQEDSLPHEQQAEGAERVGTEFEERIDRLGDRIDDARADWDRKRADANVPGAPPREEDVADEGGPEADYPTKGSAEHATEGVGDSGEDVDRGAP